MTNVTQLRDQTRRREQRRDVEMFAHFRRGVATVTVMLKDLTPSGARIEGVPDLLEDEAVSLALPGRKPALAFVAWSNAHCAGLEFAEPVPVGLFDALVSQFAVGGRAPPEPPRRAPDALAA